MPISIEERYKLICDQFKFTCEYRIKLVTGWFAIYAALAVAFSWIQQASKPLSCIITIAGIITTIYMWLADRRHRPSIGRSKHVGKSIEVDPSAGIPEDQRFFSGIDKGPPHGWLIDFLALIMILFLVLATWYLICTRGELPKNRTCDNTCVPAYNSSSNEAHFIPLRSAGKRSI